MKKLAALILAAGKGTRMRSKTPKVLHRVCGQPLVQFPVELAQKLGCDPIVLVVGHGREQVQEIIKPLAKNTKIEFALQEQQLGTGHAVMAGLQKLKSHKGLLLILSGDVPLLDKRSISSLLRAYEKNSAKIAFLSFHPEDPTGYGRVIREGKRVVAIREHRDCSKAERTIGEVNSGIYIVEAAFLRKAVKNLKSNNDQSELYMTDIVEMAANKGNAVAIPVATELVSGVNDRVDLAGIEKIVRTNTNLALMRRGVTMPQPETIHVDIGVKVGADTILGAGAQLLGQTTIGKDCSIEPGAIIRDSNVADGASIHAYSILDQAHVGPRAEVGPMGRLRPGAYLSELAKVGNFVEVKKTVMGKGSKANHLAYLGDGQIGDRVNVGAGTIFCNYDGFQKHTTTLGDDVFIGSDSQLIAPVTIGARAYVGSGSTITKDVPEEALAVSRTKQENKAGVGAVLRRRFAALKRKALAKVESQSIAKEKKKTAKKGKNAS